MNRIRISPFIPVLVMLAGGCATTSLSTTWRNPSATPIEFKNVIVLALNSTPGERRALEDTIVGQIEHAHAVASYMQISDDVLKDQAATKTKIVAGGFDGAIVMRLIDSRQQKTYVPGS